jgi:NAD(P)-dependent dehydrogenase (short-subunit alcohol dehydrogenase family)
MQPLKGKVALVAGATRGAGRGIACMLGEAGATVYCTGRSSRASHVAQARGPEDTAFTLATRPETIEETAELVGKHGGVGIAARVDHTVEAEVAALFERVEAEQGGLDILVNDVWGGDELTAWGTKFWEIAIAPGWRMQERAVLSHIITSKHGAPLLIKRGGGLLVEITDGVGDHYRGSLFYDLAKTSVNRLAFIMAEELRPHGITALAVTPGFLRSEAMLEHFGVTEENWRDGAKMDEHFIASETPFFVGRAVAALAADPNVAEKTGGAFSSWELSDEYGFRDINGEQPHWGRYIAKLGRPLAHP